ncbi:MAG: CRISPR system precrRNA processing endoribonuclease RAMP protein Cas6 [Ignavibacteria bacterium]|jgi:hypothetical protein|nr:CRISPR system precrRNA processing endoribonuclease RAMP protein Cas6 [Ignavibacteria bacterium]
MSKSLPSYLKNFTCYLLRVQFAAQKDVEIKEKWWYLPSYALGDALMNSKNYQHLYDTLFKPTQGRFKNVPSRIIVRADSTRRSKFVKKEILNLYITIVSNNKQEITDFIDFLPEWADFHFFKKYSFRFHSSYVLNPLSNEFEPSRQSNIEPLDYKFFNKHLVKWKDALEIRFLTPTTYYKDRILSPTDEVFYDDLIKRIQNRALNLYFSFLAPSEEIDESSNFIVETNAVTLLNGLSFPRQMIIKKQKYTLSGIKGFIRYSVPYSYKDDYLLALAHYIHVGSNTKIGNGQIEAIALSEQESELVVTLPGSFIGVSKDTFRVKNGNKIVISRPISTISQITILAPNVTVSSYVTRYCAKKNIRIVCSYTLN